MAGVRRKARVIALQALFEIDCTGHDAGKVVNRIADEAGLLGDNAVFAQKLVSGVIQSKAEIDRNIQSFAPAWPIDQMPVVDRNILRLAIFEVLLDNKVPVRAAINEAVELARMFGSESSPKFVNGVLGSVTSLVHR
ncbi:transcription antitermination factor NusB [Chloroflexota bacterium]